MSRNAPIVVEKAEKIVAQGLSVTTNNHTEMESDKAKIAPLWSEFYQQYGEVLAGATGVYGVYIHQGSHDRLKYGDGDYDYEVSAVATGVDLPGAKTVTIPAGRYLKFTRTGSLPAIAIEAWEEVWSYMRADDSPYHAAYLVDFEEYLPNLDTPDESQINVYVSIE